MRVKCPSCGREEEIEIGREILDRAERSASGITTVVISHGDHAMIVYIDREGKVRSLESAAIPSRGRDLLSKIREVPIPSESPPDISLLRRDEWRFLALCDGEKGISEIATLLGISTGRARLMAESLRARGYLREIRVEMG